MRIAVLTLVLVSLFSCGTEKKTDDKEFLESLDSVQVSGSADSELVNSILNQIPSPLEISVLLKKSGTSYNNSILNSADNASRYNTNYKKALNLGIYGTDLGYTNIFEKSEQGFKYIATIKKLADELNIGQFFDVETIGKLAANNDNLDSLLLLTTQNFNDINHYLQSQGRDNLSVLLLTGGWLEAMHITCQTATLKQVKELYETIGEQKIILEQLVSIYDQYPSDANMVGLQEDLKKLSSVYEKVTISHIYKESTTEIVNGVAIVKDNSSTTVDISPEVIVEIQKVVDAIRTKIIS